MKVNEVTGITMYPVKGIIIGKIKKLRIVYMYI